MYMHCINAILLLLISSTKQRGKTHLTKNKKIVMVHLIFCFPLSFLAALFINQRKQRQHSSLRKGLTLRSNKKFAPSSYYFVKEICDQSKSLVHIITWLKARSWKCEIWIRSYPWIWMDTSYAKGNKVAISKENISRAAFQQHCPLKHDVIIQI